MKTKFLLIGLAILIIVGGFFLFQNFVKKQIEQKGPISKELKTEQTFSVKPWIEVVSGKVNKKDQKTEKILSELKTGDEIEQGDFIETDKQGLAIIYFPDGSVARMEQNTSLIIDQAEFNKESNSLKAKIKIKIGRVWSRIIQIVGADSFWEVKTSNVVATVRGTAFGVEHTNQKSLILVDKGEVETEAFDVETNEKIQGTKTILKKDKVLEIKKEEIKELRKKPRELIVKAISKEILKEEWIKRNKESDIRYIEKIEELKEKGLEREEIGKELKKEIIEKFEEEKRKNQEIKETINPEQNDSEIKKLIEPEKLIEPLKDDETELKIKESIELPKETLEVIPKKLEIVMFEKINELFEGDKLNLKAVLIMSDGSKKDITKECKWQVLGEIGNMEAPGLFKAKLDISIVELGQSPGRIICSFIDAKTKKAFLGSTPIINIKVKAEMDFETRG